MITFKVKGDFKNTLNYIEKVRNIFRSGILDRYGRRGVEELKRRTPVDTGETQNSWSYQVRHFKTTSIIQFDNDNVNDNVNVAVVLQYGRATVSGSWIPGVDYINPALIPVFEDLINDICKEVKNV